jgi:hypothetical protein
MGKQLLCNGQWYNSGSLEIYMDNHHRYVLESIKINLDNVERIIIVQ